MKGRTLWGGVVALGIVGVSAAYGQPQDGNGLPSFDGPPAPQAPATFVRDAQGRATIRAIRLTEPLRVDGRLDESVYEAPPVTDFIQMEPDGGRPATERTEVWILFDQANVYVAMRIWESDPARRVANEMRRDSNNIRQGDAVGFSLDTYYDRRNAFQFEVNVLGARTDGQSTNERQYSADWNPVWDLAARPFEQGWSFEAAIPFKSLRYRPGRQQVWGFNARRNVKWKNEIAYLSPVPQAFGLGRGDFSASLFPTLTGLEAPAESRNVEVKPYAITDLSTDTNATPRISNRVSGDFGIDARYGLGQNLSADFTYNTDFAQVEADEQQVNLTRFSLFFPEKREFFLENQGTFSFGGVGGIVAGGGAGANTPVLFYSRRIGLSQGLEVPIDAGGRLTGRVGRFSLGLLNIQTRDEPAAGAADTNFSVVRVKRDILRRSSVGLIATNRSVAQNQRGSNQAYGVDGSFAFFDNVLVNAYWAKTESEGLVGDDVSYRGQFEYAGDRYGLLLERLAVGDNFNPEVGFVRRDNMRRNFALARFSPRPQRIAAVRKFVWIGTVDYTENGVGVLETREVGGEFAIELENSDRFSIGGNDSYELLTRPFSITPTVRIPIGSYNFTSLRAGYAFGQQRRVSGNLTAEAGTFYDGRRKTLAFSRGRLNLSPQLSVEPNVSVNWIDLPVGSFTTNLIGSRVTYTVTPLMFVSALVQYNSANHLASTNIRLRWEYLPGSELFVVYNEERDSLGTRFPDLENRALIVKINRLFRF